MKKCYFCGSNKKIRLYKFKFVCPECMIKYKWLPEKMEMEKEFKNYLDNPTINFKMISGRKIAVSLTYETKNLKKKMKNVK
jgi:hypothetical protein